MDNRKKSPLDVEYTSGGIYNAKKLSKRPSVRMKYGINPSVSMTTYQILSMNVYNRKQ